MNAQAPFDSFDGKRQVAAIVFTDTVNSCRAMGQDEKDMLAKLQRDFRAMSLICTKLRGKLIKTTGDGLLMYFTSAFDAVCFAIRSQQHFAFQAGTSPVGTCLQHRIAIHIGDVVISRADIMGDGVNIAARVLNETEPGGICITQLVYDLVRQKLTLRTDCLGARELKNIQQRIPIYRIILDSAGDKRTVAAAALLCSPMVFARRLFGGPGRAGAAVLISALAMGACAMAIGGYVANSGGHTNAETKSQPEAQPGPERAPFRSRGDLNTLPPVRPGFPPREGDPRYRPLRQPSRLPGPGRDRRSDEPDLSSSARAEGGGTGVVE